MAKIVNSCKRGLDILELFAGSPNGLTVSEVSRLLKAPMSSCVDLVYTLEQKDFLSRADNQKRYVATGKLLYLGRQLASGDLVQLAEQGLNELHAKTGETCVLSRLAEGRATVISVRESNHPLRYSTSIGKTLPFHVTASGKSMLAIMTQGQFKETVSQLKMRSATDKTIIRKSEFLQEIELVRQRGWAASREEAYSGILSLAMAFKIDGQIYAISVVGPQQRMEKSEEKYITYLQKIQEQFQL